MFRHLAKLAFHHSGALDLVRRLNENRVRILMYHRFPQQDANSFDRQCAFLAANYNVVSLDDAARRLKGREPIVNLAVITIDDGYADVHEVAYPILRKHRLPATLFVTTGFIDRKCWMPGDRVRNYFAHPGADTISVIDDADRAHPFRTRDPTASDELRALLKRVPDRTRRRILFELDGGLPVPDAASMPREYAPCTWDQLRELADGGIDIGAHTVTHPILSRVEVATDAEQEIVESKREIEEELQRPVETFAYPNGMREDIDQVSVACVRKSFEAAVTAISGLNTPGADLHQLLRLPCDPDLPLSRMARLLAGPVVGRPTPQPTAYPG